MHSWLVSVKVSAHKIDNVKQSTLKILVVQKELDCVFSDMCNIYFVICRYVYWIEAKLLRDVKCRYIRLMFI